MGSFGAMVRFEGRREAEAGELATKTRSLPPQLDSDRAVHQGEIHLVTGDHSEVLPQGLRDHDLSFRAHTVSHTGKCDSVDTSQGT